MHSRRKRYYHKTIVIRNASGHVLIVLLIAMIAIVVFAVGKNKISVGSQTVIHALEHVFCRQEISLQMPTVYERLVRVMPMIQSSEGQRKTMLAKTKGVKRKAASENEDITEAVPIQLKSMDMSAKGISFRNETGYTPDVETCLNQKLSFRAESQEPAVLIMHTHTSEAYVESEGARTQDSSKNVVRVGEILSDTLEKSGVSVIHDKTKNDYPSYNGSYTKALTNIKTQLQKHPSLEIVLDVHRDYAEQTQNGEKIQLKPVTEINGEAVAQVMLVIGTDGLGLEHPDWKENLAFAVQLQAQLQKISPKLARPLNLRRERFNQHLTKGSLILEVGTAGNTVVECERAAKYIGQALAAILR